MYIYLWKLALFINKSNDIEWFCSKKVKNLLVIFKLNVLPFNAFLVILCLFQLEDVVYKELLKIFITEVDAQLFKTVGFKSLKPKNVQYTN